MSVNLQNIKGLGPASEKLLAKLNIHSVEDLLNHYPTRYIDYSNVTTVADAHLGPVALKGHFTSVTGRWTRNRKHITEARFSDGSGTLKVQWFSQPYRKESLPLHTTVLLTGELDVHGNIISMLHPDYTLGSDFKKNEPLLVPVYPLSAGLKNKQICKWMQQAIDDYATSLPPLITKLAGELGLQPPQDLLRKLHLPRSQEDITLARFWLSFEELFVLMSAGALGKLEHQSFQAPAIPADISIIKSALADLNFDLTDTQKRSLWEVAQDMSNAHPMNRLLNGDVGSGKTIVAIIAALLAVKSGLQVAVMAPTSLLAMQLYTEFTKLLSARNVSVDILTGASSKSQRKSIAVRLADNSLQVLVGTHALFEDTVGFNNLGLVIIDEQHRFGVKQRSKLQKKGSGLPHLLSMSATPIPRTLALTIYGDLDISVIDQLPPGRKPVITEVCSQKDRSQVYECIEQKITKGQQVYVVCPLIDESDTLGVKSVIAEKKRLDSTVFAHRKVGLLHGKLTPTEKEAVMSQFIAGKLDILVSTTVIEVGVNVPNATTMIIEGAERFGLAQAHQLRGRVRRSTEQGHCYLFGTQSSSNNTRLQILEKSDNGFELAEKDLEMRGPGALYGAMQTGALDLRIANLQDRKLLAQVRSAAKNFITANHERLHEYPYLLDKIQHARTITKLN